MKACSIIFSLFADYAFLACFLDVNEEVTASKVEVRYPEVLLFLRKVEQHENNVLKELEFLRKTYYDKCDSGAWTMMLQRPICLLR